jgi:hypothetical protein
MVKVVVDIQVTVSLYTFGGLKVIFFRRYDLGGSPQRELLLFTPWRRSLKCLLMIGDKELLMFHLNGKID